MATRMYTRRAYRDVCDIALMKSIAGRRFASDRSDVPFGGLEWVVFGPHGFPPAGIVQIWEDAQGGVAGWALLESDGAFEYRVAPALRRGGLEREIIARGERGILSWRKANGLEPRCAVECWDGDAPRIEILIERGYQPSEAAGVLFWRSLDGDVPPARAPEGWTVRGVTDADVDDRARTQYEAFSPGSRTTPDTWRYLMKNAPGYERDLDNVAVREDGVFGAAALVWLDEEGGAGEFEPVGTRPAFQRMGLGRAILLRGLAKMQERGMETAFVRTNATNVPAVALYESVGFEVCARSVEYVLSTESTEDPEG